MQELVPGSSELLSSWTSGLQIPWKAFLLGTGMLLVRVESGKVLGIQPLPLNSHVTLATFSLSQSSLLDYLEN